MLFLCICLCLTLLVNARIVTVNLNVFLEGAYDSNLGTMNSQLLQRGVVPAGQPYNDAPWSYPGTEGQGWSPGDYPAGTVDWVLITLKDPSDINTEITRIAAILLQNGSIVPFDVSLDNTINSVYIQIEHRNHLPILTAQAIAIPNNNSLTYDFTGEDSYTSNGFGQKQIGNDWMMFAGNTYQVDQDACDINAQDKGIWEVDNGLFSLYNNSDFNLDGDVSALDRILFSYNNGVFSKIPKSTPNSTVKWGFWGEDRNAYSGGGFTPDPDQGVETLFENYSFAHTKGMNLDWVNGDTNQRAYVVNILNAAASTTTTLDIQLGSSAEYGWNFSTGTGNFNVDRWKDMISKFGNVNRPSFFDNSTIQGDPAAHAAIVNALNTGTIKYIFLIDEPNHGRWSPGGGNRNYVTNAMLEEMAAWVKTVFADATVPIYTIVRTSAMNLAVNRGGVYNFQHLTHTYFTISSTKWVSNNTGPNKGLEWWMTEKNNFFNSTEMSMYAQQGLKMSLMVQAGFESKGHPWTSVKNFANTWWEGSIQYPYNGVTSYVKAAPGEMDFWIKSMLSPRDPATGILDPNGVRLIDDFVIFRHDRLPTDNGKLPWTTRPHYRDFLTQLGLDVAANNLVPVVGIPVGWDGN